MKQNDVQIGGRYHAKIGSRLAEVTVLRRLEGHGRARFECRTGDTGRTIKATAARLRPCIDSPRGRIVAPTAIPGVALNPARKMERMEQFNSGGIVRFCDRLHVSMPLRQACREFVRSVNRRSLRDFTPEFRRGALHCVMACHAFNRDQYRQVMGHAPIPTEEMVAAAMIGDEAARAAILA